MSEVGNTVLHAGPFITVTLGIVVLFLGKRLNDKFTFLREMSIPEPVTGGLAVAALTAAIYAFSGVSIDFELTARDVLLVYFFTTIGINASFLDLRKGGRPLAIVLGIAIGGMILQNLLGISVAMLFREPSVIGLLGGTISLVGGHGTAIAWSQRIAESHDLASAQEIALVCATLGLIFASLAGGPIARFLIIRHGLRPPEQAPLDIGVSAAAQRQPIDSLEFLDAVLAIHVCVLVGLGFQVGLHALGVSLPLFVPCLFAGILLTNLLPPTFPRFSGKAWPSRSPAMALIADVSLGTFLAMSLMSLQLWTLIELAGPILAIMAVQLLFAVVVCLFVVFRALGRNFDAAVICAGFSGFYLGSTPIAMANMTAVTTRYGPSHLAFIIVPVICAFFIDMINAWLIPVFLAFV